MENHLKKSPDTDFRYQIKDRIERLESPEDVFDVFRCLDYPPSSILDPTFKRDLEGFDFAKDEKSKVDDIYTVLSLEDKLPVFLVETTTLNPSFVRYISKVFAERYLRLLIIFTVDYSELLVVFPEFEKVKIGKHKLKLSKLLLNRQELYYTDIDTVSKLRFNEDGNNWRDTWLDWKKAFSVSRVTNEFFEDYKKRFFRIRDHLVDSGISTKDAHELRRRSEYVYPCGFGDIFRVFKNDSVWIDKRLYEVYSEYPELWGLLNSTPSFMFWEIGSRTGLGDGLLDLTVYEVEKTYMLNPTSLKESQKDNIKKSLLEMSNRPIGNIFTELSFDPTKPIREQEPEPLPDRKALDDVVFDAIGLTDDERKEVYWAVTELVKQAG